MASYVSEELTHFLGAGLPTDEDRFRLLLKIIGDGTLLDRKELLRTKKSRVSFFDIVDKDGAVSHQDYFPDPYYDTDITLKTDSNQFVEPDKVCFCDIPYEPVDHFRIHTTKYKRFGLAFARDFLIEQGANPVFYIARAAATTMYLLGGSGPKPDFYLDHTVPSLFGTRTRADFFNQVNTRLLELVESTANMTQSELDQYVKGTCDPRELKKRVYQSVDLPITLFAYLFGYTKFFDATLSESDPNNYYMEREWRVLGRVAFTLSDLRRVLLPPEFIPRFRAAVPAYPGPVLELPDPNAA